jgi:hypothetical protein
MLERLVCGLAAAVSELGRTADSQLIEALRGPGVWCAAGGGLPGLT